MTNLADHRHNDLVNTLAGPNTFPLQAFQRPTVLFRNNVVNFDLLSRHGRFRMVYAVERKSDRRQVAVTVVPEERLERYIEVRHGAFTVK